LPARGSIVGELSLSSFVGMAVGGSIEERKGKLFKGVHQQGKASVFSIKLHAAQPARVLSFDFMLVKAH